MSAGPEFQFGLLKNDRFIRPSAGDRSRQLPPASLAECRGLLSLPITELLPNFRRDFRDLYLQLTAVDLRRCPVCKIGTLIIVEVLPRIPYQDTS